MFIDSTYGRRPIQSIELGDVLQCADEATQEEANRRLEIFFFGQTSKEQNPFLQVSLSVHLRTSTNAFVRSVFFMWNPTLMEAAAIVAIVLANGQGITYLRRLLWNGLVQIRGHCT